MSSRPRRLRGRRPFQLDLDHVLAWADAYHTRTGRWPTCESGTVRESDSLSWSAVDKALRYGWRGLPGSSSLPALLAEQRGVPFRPRNASHQFLSVHGILKWADAYHDRNGCWPRRTSGPVNGTSWFAIDACLRKGLRKLPGGSSLSQLLTEHRGVRNLKELSPLSADMILSWADHHFRKTGNWPARQSGPIEGVPGETWSSISSALTVGRRGLPGGSSLADLLSRERGRRNHYDLPKLTVRRILGWADAYRARNGDWPRYESGSIPESEGETWSRVDTALQAGLRGLPGGSSLALLLTEKRGRRHLFFPPPLTPKQILIWADAHIKRTGRRPTYTSGAIPGSLGETWVMVHGALRHGRRGFPGGSSLAQFLDEHGRT